MARGTRGSGAKNRGKNNLSSRQELIKKHGLSSFREDPVENRKLQETSSVNFTEQYGAVKHKDRFLGDPKVYWWSRCKKIPDKK